MHPLSNLFVYEWPHFYNHSNSDILRVFQKGCAVFQATVTLFTFHAAGCLVHRQHVL